MKSSAIIRKTLAGGHYRAFTGYTRDGVYMCYAINWLERVKPDMLDDLRRTRYHIQYALGEAVFLNSLFSAYGWNPEGKAMDVPDARLRRLAVGFYEDLADYLESIGD